MRPHDSHGLSAREAELRLEEVEGVVSVPLWVWLYFRLVSSVGYRVAGHTVTPAVLELNLSWESHLGQRNRDYYIAVQCSGSDPTAVREYCRNVS